MSYRIDAGKLPSHGTKDKNTYQLEKSNTTLDTIATNTADNTILNTIANNEIHKKPTGGASISSAGGIAVYADSSPIPSLDNDNRDGWLFEKTVADASKFNYYFYGKGNKSLKLGDLKSISAIVTIDKYAASNDLPFFNVYTTMDAGPNAGAWYKSRVTYTPTADETIMLGESIEIYSGLKPTSHTGKRQVEFNTVSTVGTGADDEEIYTIAMGSDSAAPIGLKILCEQLGLDFFTADNKIETRLNLN